MGQRAGRQADGELGAAAGFALHVDGAAVGLDDLPRRRQPQAVCRRLVVWNGRNSLGSCSGGMPLPVSITSRQTPFAVALAPMQRQLAAVGHGLLGVEHQVEQALLEQVAVEVHRRQVGGGNHLISMLFCRGGGREEVDQSRRRPRRAAVGSVVEFLDAGEAEEVVGEIDELLALAVEPRDAVEGAALALASRVLEVLGQQLQVEAEGAEVVLDLVDEAAGQFGQFGVLSVRSRAVDESRRPAWRRREARQSRPRGLTRRSCTANDHGEAVASPFRVGLSEASPSSRAADRRGARRRGRPAAAAVAAALRRRPPPRRRLVAAPVAAAVAPVAAARVAAVLARRRGRRRRSPAGFAAALLGGSSALRDSLTRSWSSMAITLTCILSPTLHHVVDPADVLVVQLADVAQPVAAGQDLDERAEVLDRRHLALVDLADLDLLGQRLDLGAWPPRRRRRRCAAMYTVPSSSMSIFAPVASWMPLIVLPPGPISRPIFSGLIFIVQQPRGVRADLLARRPQGRRASS